MMLIAFIFEHFSQPNGARSTDAGVSGESSSLELCQATRRKTEQIMKKLFSGIHGLVPNPPKMPIVGKETKSKLVKRSKLKKPTYLHLI